MFLQCLCLNHQVQYLASDIEISSFHSFAAHLLSSSFVPRISKRRFTFIACSNYSGSGRNNIKAVLYRFIYAFFSGLRSVLLAKVLFLRISLVTEDCEKL